MATIQTHRYGLGRAITRHGGEPLLDAQTRSTATRTARALRGMDAFKGVDVPRVV